jgi:hypothetical protein
MPISRYASLSLFFANILHSLHFISYYLSLSVCLSLSLSLQMLEMLESKKMFPPPGVMIPKKIAQIILWVTIVVGVFASITIILQDAGVL